MEGTPQGDVPGLGRKLSRPSWMYGGMADAIDLRSIFRSEVGVQVPLHLQRKHLA